MEQHGIAFPGGHIEPRELFIESVKREVYEETGYHIEKPILYGMRQFQKDCVVRYVILLYKTNQLHGTLWSSSEGKVSWLERSKLKAHPLARGMDAMIELFDNDEKSEFYYLPDSLEEKYLIW